MARSKYQMRGKGMRGGRRKQSNGKDNTNRVWLKSRHRVRRKILGG